MTEESLASETARRELYEVMQSEEGFETKARRALELGVAYLGVENGHVTKIDPQSDYWETILSTDPQSGDFPEGLRLDLSSTYCRRLPEEGGTIELHDAPSQGWADDPAYLEHGLACYHGTNLRVAGQTYGSVCFVSKEPRAEPFTEAERSFAELVARMLEYELEHERQAAELRRRGNVINVLDRVLRHNLRNNLSVVRGHVHLLADKVRGSVESVDIIIEKIENLLRLSDTARELNAVVTENYEHERVDVIAMSERVVDSVRRQYPETAFRVEGPEDLSIRASPSFERAVLELVTNAAKHSPAGSTVQLTLGQEPNAARIAVADEGGGLPESEQQVLEGGDETPLLHGSGLGLWLVHRIVSSHSGEILTDVDASGTTITVSVPRTSADWSGDAETSAELAFEQVHDRFRAVFDEAFDAMVIVDDEQRCMDVNESLLKLVGRNEADVIGRPLEDFVVEGEALRQSWANFTDEGTIRGTIVVEAEDGTEHTVEYTGTTNIVPGQHLLVCRDLTEQLERERQLSETRERLEMAISATSTGIFEWRVDSGEVEWSAELESMVGLDPGEFEGTFEAFERRLHPADADAVEETLQTALETGESYEQEMRLRHEDGQDVWVNARGKLLEHDAGSKVVGIVTDITDRKRRERELQETSQLLEAVVESSPDPVIATNAEGDVILWNEAAEDVFGYERGEVMGKPLVEVGIHPAGSEEAFHERMERVRNGEQFSGIVLNRQTRDGEPVTVRISTAPLQTASNNQPGVVAVAQVLDEPA